MSPHRPRSYWLRSCMNTTIKHNYDRMRKAGMDADDSLKAAKILAEWEEAGDLVRLRCEPEQESYFDVYGEPEGYTNIYGRRVSAEQERKEMCDEIEHNGLWCVIAEYRESEDSETWHCADSIGMCCYDNPLDATQNSYVPDLMSSALDALRAQAYAPAL